MTTPEMKERLKRFALRILAMSKALPRTREAEIVAKQIIRSATSVGANYRAACRGKSRADFAHKLTIAEEEADETQYWLEIICDHGMIARERLTDIMREAGEITAILTAARKSTKNSP